MLYDKTLISKEERDLIILLQNNIIDALMASKNILAEEEIAYCLKVALGNDKVRIVVEQL